MKKTKKFLISIFFLLMMFLVIPQNQKAEGASPNLVVVTSSSGSPLTYRGSSEKVYMLEEYNYPTNQLRACWVSTFVGDVPAYSSESQYKSAVNTVLDNMERMGMNTIVFHVRTHNNALYKSELNPVASWWSGVNFNTFDPLEWVINECHSRGIEFHAWLNPYRVSSNGSISQYKSGSMPAANPANKPENLLQSGNNIILDPGIPENRDFIVDTCMEIVENYDVDAIHFDDYFYINGADDAATREKYNTENLSLGDFRRKQVDLFIEDLSKHLRSFNEKNNKTVQLGISPSNVYRNGGYYAGEPKYDANGNLTAPLYSNTGGFAHYDNYLYSDTVNWINHEWIDYIMPQAYHPIEQTSASYAEVVRWWSYVVRYKKVNLYTGIGIYMAVDSPTYWQKHTNEVELELLISGQYEEFKGACFYKYNYMLKTSNAVINDAVDTISNDFWKKKIPGAVMQYYAPLIEEVKVSNLSYNATTKTIQWNPLENVRGYMVYQVPRGEKLDKNNINHVYQYTQSTSITVNDTTGYDYYVSSVNLANETSEAEYVNINLNASDVIALIDALPETVDYSHLNQVTNARNVYEKLSESEKAKVTNIDKLIRLENALHNYDTLSAALDAYINGLDTYVPSNRILPHPENISLSYKNQSDANLYNITTGERLKNYLATKLIPLVATIQQDGLTLSKEFEINIGLTKKTQVGLFYRNDPSSMSPDDEGECGPSSGKYIGWSGHTFVIEDFVLYIADKNYFEITDASAIEKCNWVSVAGVYVNKTANSLTMTLGNAFDSKSCSNDGYIVISNNAVKEVSHGFDATTAVTLEKNDALVILRYLDNSLTGSPLTPVTKFSVGTKAYIDTDNPLTDAEKAQLIMDKINAIPTPITLSSEQLINEAKDSYDNAADSVKALVTNYETLQSYINQIATLKEELATQKQNAIQELNNYLDKTLYSPENQTTIEQLIQNGVATITEALSITEIETIVTTYKKELDKVKTIEEEFALYKQQQMNQLNKYLDKTLYDQNGKTQINETLGQAQVDMNKASTKQEVDALVVSYKEKLDEIPTIAETLATTKIEYINKLKKLISTYDVVTKVEEELQKIALDATTRINQAKNVSEVTTIYNDTHSVIETYIENLTNAKNKAKNDVLAYIDTLNYVNNEIIEIKQLYQQYLLQLEEMAQVEEITSSVDTIKEEITGFHQELETKKTNAKQELDNLILETYTKGQKKYLDGKKKETKSKIDQAGTIDEVEAIISTYEEETDTYIQSMNQKIEEISTYFDSKLNEDAYVVSLVNDNKEKLKEQTSIQELETVRLTFDEALQNYKPEEKKGCNCSSTIIYSLLLCLTITAIAIIKKNAFR